MPAKLAQLLDNFRLKTHREDYRSIIRTIEEGVIFRGTNLWVLIFAIFIASLGLNVNSPAVIIGAMLVSPLMGPIMGLGLAMGINDLALLRKSAQNFAFAVAVSLATSTLFFFLSPLNQAHSELLARTAPNAYDVLIAFIGGLAGILATASKLKGNVLPGVAIATALMPPLCTAGYGIATLQAKFFVGAFYLFVINTVFIALATLITVRFLHFPYKEKPDTDQARRAKRIIGILTAATLLPSIYLAYGIIEQTRYIKRAERYVEHEAALPGDYLLNKDIDPEKRTITLTFGGKRIDQSQIAEMRRRLQAYNLSGTELHVKQGFAIATESQGDSATDSRRDATDRLGQQLLSEIQVQYTAVTAIAIAQARSIGSPGAMEDLWLVLVQSSEPVAIEFRRRIRDWLRVRLNAADLEVTFRSEKKQPTK